MAQNLTFSFRNQHSTNSLKMHCEHWQFGEENQCLKKWGWEEYQIVGNNNNPEKK